MNWFDSTEPFFSHLAEYGKKVGTVVTELAQHLPELKDVTQRSRYMVTCYPGNGARYTRHCDNADRNGRRLTALLYLNPDWKPTDGGSLRVFEPDGVTLKR